MKSKFIFILMSLLLIFICLLSLRYSSVAIGILISLSPFISMILFIVSGIFLYKIGSRIGSSKHRIELKKEMDKLNLENPYIYFRDIPNKYGIGVALILFKCKIGKEDVFAGILDLCAKGYVKLKQNGKFYEIYDNKKDISMLLSNEKFLLSYILSERNKKMNLKEWVKLCKQDVINLGLAKENDRNKYNPLFSFDIKFAKILFFISFIISFFIVFLIDFFVKVSNGIFINLVMSLFLSMPIWLILFFILLFISLIYEGKILTYNEMKSNSLILTDLGKNEYYELCALGKFLDDFGNFTDSHIEEVVIWEQYLSYAILFRLSNKILKTGYEKLSINDNFIIEDLDKIVL